MAKDDKMTKIGVSKKETTIETPFSPAMFAIARGLPAQFRWDGKTLIVRTVRANLDYLREVFPDAEWIDEDGALAEINGVADIKKTSPTDTGDYVFGTEPFDYQRDCFLVSRARRSFAIFLEMGLGKTKVLIDTACYLFREGLIDRVLVIAPNGVHRQWVLQQIEKHTPAWCKLGRISYWKEPARRKNLRSPDADGLQWFAMNVEALSHKSGLDAASAFLKAGTALCAIDESVRIKSPSSSRTRAAKKLRKLSAYRRILSGRPITKGIEDLYSQYDWLDPAIIGIDTFTAFKARYCELRRVQRRRVEGQPPLNAYTDHFDQIVGYKHLDELTKRLAPHTFIAHKKDYPAKIYLRRIVPVTPEQKTIYKRMLEELIVEIETGVIVDLKNAAVRLTRLQQVLCGHMPDDDGHMLSVPSNRVQILRDALEESGKKTVIWARFKEDIIKIKEELGDECVVYTGGQDENNAIARFIKEPDIHFLGNPASGGTGIDGLQAVCNNMIYYSNSFNGDHRFQSEDRIHRYGIVGDCTYVDLYCPGTVDGKLLRSFKSKIEFSDQILKNPRMLAYDSDELIEDEIIRF